MLSEGSCDTEDWSNDAENSALPSQESIWPTHTTNLTSESSQRSLRRLHRLALSHKRN